MFEKLEVFRIAAAMAQHAGQKQAVVAQNVANADTPGYRARDLPAFQTIFQSPTHMNQPRATRARHLNSAQQVPGVIAVFEEKNPASPNGNQVSLEAEILKSVSAKRQHDRALAIYKSALGILRTSMRSN
ncbi:MAG: FlgB family protein [Pseudomonadota bacterium]